MKHNAIAYDLRRPKYRMRVVESKKIYSRDSWIPQEPNENHQRCFHCGVYTDECQCDGGLS